MISAFGIDHSLIVKAARDNERGQHYGRMAGAMGTIGATTTAVAAGSHLVQRREEHGHDPMGFLERHKPGQGPLPAAKRAEMLEQLSREHKYMATRGGALGAAGLGLAGTYKLKQHRERQRQQVAALQRRVSTGKRDNPQRSQRLRTAGDVGLGAASVGLGGATMYGGGQYAGIMGAHAAEAAGKVRRAQHMIAGHKMKRGGTPLEPHELEWARRQRKVFGRAAAVKGPVAATLLGSAAIAGGAGIAEVGRHATHGLREKKR